MLRGQDILFGLFGLLVVVLLMFHFRVGVLALLGGSVCGSVYLFAGMLPSREEPFWRRTFTSVFLSLVVSSLVLILPGTMGAQTGHPAVETAVMAIAALLPILAVGFEVLRTPHLIRGILRYFGYR